MFLSPSSLRSVKCSAANTCTAYWAATAVPIALVPAPDSLHRAPSMKFISSAARLRSRSSPWMRSNMPFGVADDEQALGLDRGLGHAVRDQSSGARQRMVVPEIARPLELHHRRRGLAAARINPRFQGPLPGVDGYPRAPRHGACVLGRSGRGRSIQWL